MPPERGANRILRRMIRGNDDYWDCDRATYEDELGAWRERTAVAVAVTAPMTRSETRRSTRPSRPARPATLGQISTHGLLGRVRRRDRIARGNHGRGHARIKPVARSKLLSNPSNGPPNWPSSPSMDIWPHRERRDNAGGVRRPPQRASDRPSGTRREASPRARRAGGGLSPCRPR